MDIDSIIVLYRTRGGIAYGGESVSQLDHALQCALLARLAGEPDEVIAGALLHDLGHLLESGTDSLPTDRVDHRHQIIGEQALARTMSSRVAACVRLHVDAKRYLCATEPDYLSGLSPVSVKSLGLQGGPFDRDQANRFIDQPFADDAVRVRRYDDQAKIPGQVTPLLDEFVPLLRRLSAW